MKNKSKGILLFFCIAVISTHMLAQSSTAPLLYKVTGVPNGYLGQPFRASAGGDVTGEIPVPNVYEAISAEGNWAKIRFLGGEYFVWKEWLKKVDRPDIVCSPWAKEWFSYKGAFMGNAGEWGSVADDWTKTITRAEVADLLVTEIMSVIYTRWSVVFALPGVGKNSDMKEFSDCQDFEAGRLLYWGIVPEGKFNPEGTLTYYEMTDLLVKLMAYDQKYNRQNSGETFTLSHIDKFGIGGEKSPDAKCTIEQARMLCDKALLWLGELGYKTNVRHKYGFSDGIYTIRTQLGKSPEGPYVGVNKEGKLELNGGNKEQFKITYKGVSLSPYRSIMFLYTIQTLNGMFVGVSETPKNGSRLVTQDSEFLWRVDTDTSPNGRWTCFLVNPCNIRQVVNVSGWKTALGTPIITWYWKEGKGSDSDNCKFIFSKVQ